MNISIDTPKNKMEQEILVSGASIAGLTAAYWLQKAGFIVTVLEREPALRLGGQNIDVKGPGWEIIKMMGLEEKIRKANTTEVGIQFYNTDHKLLAQFPKSEAASMTQELEILRGDLVQILHDEIKNNVNFIFGDYIKVVNDTDADVEITYKSGNIKKFAFLIIAEGIGSLTREQVFKNEVTFAYLGIYTCYFTISKSDTDSLWARWCNAPGGVVILIRPDNHGTTRVCINFRSSENGYEDLSTKKKKELLISKIEGIGWEAARLVGEIRKTDDFYLDRLSQVKACNWSRGRIVMTGDAAYCVTPIGGRGTDLAITGPYIIAGELSEK
ncbi:FAD-dependent monooxygenase [Mucilaginibacter ginkgonis]|uniref:FAD-dependent monooxygenase n=1 Tax=Mucilaginibacter ginkgonis TaxID=2682091 RepID=A0A6I4HWB1_9SPHI|nr:FAD-dependent monooxygenase [Mucilaginibacter ginkgonis]QQL50140.1 FAD-dependent monooxygenase [Mucilaginibacter ginkgonis]